MQRWCTSMETKRIDWRHVQFIQEVNSYTTERSKNRLTFQCQTNQGEKASIKFDVCSPNIVRLQMIPRNFQSNRQSLRQEYLSLIVKVNWPETGFKVNEYPNHIKVKTDNLLVSIRTDSWGFALYDSDENLICRENPVDLDVLGNLRVIPLGFQVKEESTPKAYETMYLAPDEHLYGFGEKFTPLDKRGQKIVSWNVDALGASSEKSYKNIPFFMSSRGYGIFINSTGRIEYNLGTKSPISYNFEVIDNKLDYFIIYGPTFKNILKIYTKITGCAPVPPKWSFGLWMSKAGYKSREEIESVSQNLRSNDIPCDVINLDPWWMIDGKWCNFKWNRKSFPKPDEMIEKLRKKGFKLCLWEHPYISDQSTLYQEAKEQGYFITKSDGEVYRINPFKNFKGVTFRAGIVDFSNPNAVKWYKQLHEDLIKMGIKAFKTDFGEEIPQDACFYNGLTGAAMHNLYPLLYNKTVYKTLEKKLNRRGVIWGRSGYAGIQKYPVQWAGDSASDFATMANVLRGGLSYSLSGVPFWSHDIGGFYGKPDETLYLRWAQFGLLSSHARCHGTTSREPWHFGDKALKIFRFYAKLRYRLIPYLYSYAHKASQTGLPLMRPMVLEFQDDPATYNIDLQYFLGRELLVAPVFNRSGIVNVYLPKGTWIDYWSKKTFTGPIYLSKAVPLQIIPLFVRENSIIPMGPEMSYIQEKPFDPLTLDIYLDDRATFTMYDDNVDVKFECRKEGEKFSFLASEKIATYILRINNWIEPKHVVADGCQLNYFKKEHKLKEVHQGWSVNQQGSIVIKTQGTEVHCIGKNKGYE